MSIDNVRDPWDVGTTAERQALMPPPPAITLRGLKKSFDTPQGSVTALAGLDLEISRGELVCVVGPNGCGKTTLLRILAGLLPPTEGGFTLAPDPARPGEPYLLGQELDLLPWLTVEENLLLGLSRSPLTEGEYRARMEELLVQLGLRQHLHHHPWRLSGGKRQRISIVRSFLAAGDILLMDEPFAHLDPQSRRELQKLTLEMWKAGRRTVLFVTHDIPEAVHLADRILLMNGAGLGRLLVVDRPRPRDPWDPRLYSRDPLLHEILDVMRSPRRPWSPPAAEGAGASRERRPWLGWLSPLVVLVVWEVLAALQAIDTRFFPPPSQIARAAMGMLAGGELWAHWGASVLRQLTGLTLGGLLGAALGMALAVSAPLRRVVMPLVALIYPIPKIAMLPFLLLLLGFGEVSKVVTIALGAFFLLLLNTLSGVSEVAAAWGELAANLRLKGADYYYRVLLRGALPSVLVGLRAASGYCLVLLVAAEMTGTSTGLGFVIWRSWELFDIDRMYAALAALMVTGVANFAAVDALARRLSWRAPEHPRG